MGDDSSFFFGYEGRRKKGKNRWHVSLKSHPAIESGKEGNVLLGMEQHY